MSVRITLPDRGELRVSAPEAAQLLVEADGEAAVHEPITAPHSDSAWGEVDRLRAERRSDVACPGCGGRDFRAVYRVQTLCVVELTRAPNGEVLIGAPGACIGSPPEPAERDFYELLCAHCGERLDWKIDHRSLYVWGRSHR